VLFKRTSNETYKVCITYIRGPDLEFVKFGDEGNHSDSPEGYDTRIDTVGRGISEVSAGDKACLVSPIVFHSVNKMNCDLFGSTWWLRILGMSVILEGLEAKDASELCKFGIGPLCVLVLVVKKYSFLVVTRDPYAVLVDGSET
jgi:hypothetical protein